MQNAIALVSPRRGNAVPEDWNELTNLLHLWLQTNAEIQINNNIHTNTSDVVAARE